MLKPHKIYGLKDEQIKMPFRVMLNLHQSGRLKPWKLNFNFSIVLNPLSNSWTLSPWWGSPLAWRAVRQRVVASVSSISYGEIPFCHGELTYRVSLELYPKFPIVRFSFAIAIRCVHNQTKLKWKRKLNQKTTNGSNPKFVRLFFFSNCTVQFGSQFGIWKLNQTV